jgi:Leucine-rich repeat (LRR) protein
MTLHPLSMIFLVELDMSDNQLDDISDVDWPPALRVLALNSNAIQQIPPKLLDPEAPLVHFVSLSTALHVADPARTMWLTRTSHPSLQRVPHIQRLHLSHNKIRELPAGISALPALERFFLT